MYGYFDWLIDRVDARQYSDLAEYLYSREFIAVLRRDRNRIDDGYELRLEYERDTQNDVGDMPCNVLEMMVALCLRCETSIMTDMDGHDHPGKWFERMLHSLGLDDMTNGYFDRARAKAIVDRFIHRKYEPNGKGGLFTLNNAFEDLRGIEIWYQMNMYLSELMF